MIQNRTTIRPAARADAAAMAEMANELNRLEGQPDDRYSAELVAELAFEDVELVGHGGDGARVRRPRRPDRHVVPVHGRVYAPADRSRPA